MRYQKVKITYKEPDGKLNKLISSIKYVNNISGTHLVSYYFNSYLNGSIADSVNLQHYLSIKYIIEGEISTFSDEDISLSIIRNNLFANDKTIQNISFPSCTTIGNSAFLNCSSLTSINFPSCTTIGNSAFANCSRLTSISFPSCTYIGSSAFQNCTSLATAYFTSISNIYSTVFKGCTSLKSLYLLTPSVPTVISMAFSDTLLKSIGYIYVLSSMYSDFIEASYLSEFSSRIVSYYE